MKSELASNRIDNVAPGWLLAFMMAAKPVCPLTYNKIWARHAGY